MTEPVATASMPKVGDVVAGKFTIERLIGQGGMGAVFAARHRELDSVVALKIMLADTSNVEATTRFKNEGRAAAKIRSEHVVRVEDVGEENGYAYMILELLDGEDLAQVLERVGRMPPSDVVACMLEGCEGVRRAHDKGIIHRDLKPSNLFVARREDGTKVVKVLDFGISKAQSALAQAPASLTSTKAMLGSPLYMSPEQLRSSKSVDFRADIWALGVIMYELLSGTLPYMGESLGELFAAILETDPAPLRTRAPEVPAELEQIVMRCLQRRPENRFQTVADVAAALVPLAQAYANGVLPSVEPGAALLGPLPSKLLVSFGGSATGVPYRQSYATDPGGSGAYRAMAPSLPGTTTGSGAYIPVVKATAPIGALTPQPHLHGASLSQSGVANPVATNATKPALPKPLLIGLSVGAALLVGAVAIFAGSSKDSGGAAQVTEGVAPSSTSATPATQAPAADNPTLPATAASIPAPVAPATPPAEPVVDKPQPAPEPSNAASPAEPKSGTKSGTSKHHAPTKTPEPTKVATKTPEPSKTPEPAKAPATPPTTKPKAPFGVETSR